jgi:hypothetical protein
MTIFNLIKMFYEKLMSFLIEKHVAKKKAIRDQYKIFSANVHSQNIAVYVHHRKH